MRKYISRPIYTERIKPFIDKQIIKIITGQRRVGKSYILYQLMDEIKKSNNLANIIYINKELKENSTIVNDELLYSFVKEKIINEVNNYLFIDEIQEIKDFEKALRSLFAENACDIFCSGSNANMLSGELATFLAGRYIKFEIHSLSYSEFLLFHQLDNNNDSLNKYLILGGMPYLNVLELNEELAFEYLRNVYSTILLKDVVARENIRNIYFLERLVEYIANNIGSIFSANNITKYLKSQKVSISVQSVLNYINPLINAYFIYKVPRFDINGLKLFEVGEKYYFEDLGLRNVISGYDYRKDIGKLMENVVFNHLINNGYSVRVGQVDNQEIDFIAQRNNEKIYCQVCYLLSDEATSEREFGNLLKIKDNYPKYVITLDEFGNREKSQGIEQIHLRDFLIEIEQS